MAPSNNELAKTVSRLLPNLSPEAIESLLSVSSYAKKGNKEVILKSGNTSRKAFMILKGTVRGYIVTDAGNEKNVLLRS